MRLGQLAKQLEEKPSKIIDFINEKKGLELELNLNLKIEEGWEKEVLAHFSNDENQEPVDESKVEELPVVEPEEDVKTENPSEEEKPEGPVEITGEVPKAVIENAPLVEREKVVLSGPKVLDKIELPEPPKPKEKTEEELKAEEERKERRERRNNRKGRGNRKENFESYEEKLKRQKAREEKAKKRKEARRKKVEEEKRKAHYLQQVEKKQQPKPKPKAVKKRKQKEEKPVNPMVVSEIEKIEKAKRGHKKSWLGRLIQKLFGL